jgi:hypothetical protein
MAVVKNDNPTRDRLKPGAGKSISSKIGLGPMFPPSLLMLDRIRADHGTLVL